MELLACRINVSDSLKWEKLTLPMYTAICAMVTWKVDPGSEAASLSSLTTNEEAAEAICTYFTFDAVLGGGTGLSPR